MNDYEKEIYIRDEFYENFSSYAPQLNQKVQKKEHSLKTGRRTDLKTIDEFDNVFLWEFKIHANSETIGQLLNYISTYKHEIKFENYVYGYIAAFSFDPDLTLSLKSLSLPIFTFKLIQI